MLSHQKLKKRTHHVARYVRIGNQCINNDIIRLIKLCFNHNNSMTVFLDDDTLDNIFFRKENGNSIYVSFRYEYEYKNNYEEIFIIENIPYIGQLKNVDRVSFGNRNHNKVKYKVVSYPFKVIDVINSEVFKQLLIMRYRNHEIY